MSKSAGQLKNVWRWIKGNLLLVILLIYFALTLCYQATSVIREAKWGTQVKPFEVQVGSGTCKLGVRYPEKIPLEPEGKRGRPLTVWAWREEGCPADAIYVHVLFSSPDDRIIFTDGDGKPRAACLDVEIGEEEAEAVPKQLYVSRRPGVLNDDRAQLEVRAVVTSAVTAAPKPEELHVQLETAWQASLRRGCDLLLGTTTLSIASIAAVMWQIWESNRRRREERAEARQQRRDAVAMRLQQWVGDEHISWAETWELLQKAEEFAEEFYPQVRRHLRMLRGRGQVAWLYEMRQWLAGKLRGNIAELEGTLERLRALDVLSEDEQRALSRFAGMVSGHSDVAGDVLEVGLQVLEIVGLSGAEIIVETVRKRGGVNKEALQEQWYRGGGAAGRYLVHKLAGRDDSVREWLERWKKAGIDPGLHPPAGLCRLWQREPSELEDKQTPFGPVKAEDDPRLQSGLFYRGHPAWHEVTARRHSLLLVPPGGGRSALILKGREYRSLRGAGGPALSLHLSLQFPLPADEAWCSLWRDALAKSLACALSADPFWLLAAPTRAQRAIGSLLLGWAGDWHRLGESLESRGLDVGEGDGRLLMELLARFRPRPPCVWENVEGAAHSARRAVGQAYGSGSVPIFVWVDVYGEQHHAHEFVRRLWHAPSPRAWGYLKIFAEAGEAAEVWMEENGLESVTVEWSDEALLKLLEHRLENFAGVDSGAMSVEEQETYRKFKRALVQAAQGSPSRLIREGNRRWPVLRKAFV